MQRIDGHYLYFLGQNLQPLRNLGENQSYMDVFVPIFMAEHVLDPFLHQSVYKIRHCLHSGEKLLNVVRDIKEKALKVEDFKGAKPEESDLINLKQCLSDFETNLSSELGLMPTYLVAKKGGYDTSDLIDNGRALFHPSLSGKVPEALSDVDQAARCIAFEVPTAAGFHLHRANESVLHKYFDAVRGSVSHPKERSMGVYLSVMEKEKLGDERVRASLRDIKNLHRNPLIHPEHSLESVEEAIDLLGAIRSAMGFMLKEIPDTKIEDEWTIVEVAEET